MKSHIRGKLGRRVICSLAILSLICGTLLPSVMINAKRTESKTKQKVVKVAFPEQEGMSKEFQSRMFDAFEQENHDARSEYKGTGLGLSIVKQMIEQMGGEISVQSKRGEGTTIAWTLTFAIDKEYKETEEQKRKLATKQINLQGLKILAAEDNHLNAEILHFMLEEAGAEVILVENGKLAVEEFERSAIGTYDYILTDIMMPVMDGYAVVKTIRSMERTDAKTIPIIALTANAFVKSKKKALEMGMDAYIIKPFTIDKLKECMAGLKREEQNTEKIIIVVGRFI